MKYAALIHAIQMAYPQIWFSCHVEHRTRGEDRGTGLTDREAAVLAHFGNGARAGTLAKHLGIGKAAMSQHVKALSERGLVTTRVDPNDRRHKVVELTEAGRRAATDGSPLDSGRLEGLLDLVPSSEREAAVAGLERLAEAAKLMQKRSGR